jgi:nucleotide-binding universal stress UspA family protein
MGPISPTALKSFFSEEISQEDAIKLTPQPGGRHLLISLDNSENSWSALEFAINNIVRNEDVLTLYTVLDPRDKPVDESHENYRIGKFNVNLDTMTNFYEKCKLMRGKMVFKFRVHSEYSKDARELILTKINNEPGKYSMLVIGTRGQSNLAGALMGSVSNYLLSQSTIPVVVVRQQ